MRNLPLTVAALLLTAAFPATARNAGSPSSSFVLESRLLDNDLELYEAARQREDAAIRQLRQAARDLDLTLGDPDAPISELRRLEADLAEGREIAYLRLRETAELRGRMYDRMERLAELAREVERRRGEEPAATPPGLSGLWKVEAQPLEVYGLMRLRAEANLVSGTYRLSNGHTGSLRGNLVGDRIELERIDSQQGVAGHLRGEVDLEAGEVHGTWQSMELAAGRPAAGEWTAVKVPDDEEISLEP